MITTVFPSRDCQMTPDQIRAIRNRVRRFNVPSPARELQMLKFRLELLVLEYNSEPSPAERRRISNMHINCFKAIALLEFPDNRHRMEREAQ